MNRTDDGHHTTAGDRVLVGYITRPVGLQGRVRVKPLADLPSLLGADTRVHVLTPRLAGAPVERVLTVEAVREDRDLAVLEFRELRDRNAAEALRQSALYLDRAQLPALDEADAWYEADLLGCAVETLDGQRLGILEAILETGANDVFQVVDGEREILIPAIRGAIQRVDLETKIIAVHWPDDGEQP